MKSPNPDPQFNPKGTTDKHLNHHRLTPEQRRFVEKTYHALVKIYSRMPAHPHAYTAHDYAGFAIEKVLRNPAEYMKRTPQHAANAIAKNSLQDFWRRQHAQRGQGARSTRVVIGDEPIYQEDEEVGSVLGNVAGTVVDAEQWIEDEHLRGVIADVQSLMSPLAFEGFRLTEIEGLDQGEAARVLSVSRSHLNREMSAAKKKIQALGISFREWGVE
jgi:DNA-directed RNA polymerase specialized sigma24 family protein